MRTQAQYWRNLAELENSPELEEFLSKEFPDTATEAPNPVSRRRFLQLMGASFALAGAATGCRWEKENILPYARRPEGLEPGSIRYFTCGMEVAGAMQAMKVACFDNRPYKVEPHDAHPFSKGGTDPYMQASILGLFDPDRSGVLWEGATRSDKDAFGTFARKHFATFAENGGEGLRILSKSSSSPTIAGLKRRVSKAMPKAKWVEWESLSRDAERAGAEMAFGAPYRAHLDLTKADVIVSLDDDLFGRHPARLKYARDWAKARKPEEGKMNRLYVVESRYTNTGASADHRLPVRAEQVKAFALALEAAVQAKMGAGKAAEAKGFLAEEKVAKHVDAIAQDLVDNRGKAVVSAGAVQPAEVHAIVHRLNERLGARGTTVQYSLEEKRSGHGEALKSLVDEMAAGSVDTLVMIDVNPAYTAPGDVDFAGALEKVKTSVHLGLYRDETAAKATWHVPMTHFMETWRDGRTWDGTVTISQPLITPLFDGTSEVELLSMVLGNFDAKPMDMVRASALAASAAGKELAKRPETKKEPAGDMEPDERDALPARDESVDMDAKPSMPVEEEVKTKASRDPELETAQKAADAFTASFEWRRIVHDGFVPNTAYPMVTPALGSFTVSPVEERAYTPSAKLGNGDFEVVFYEDGKVYDGSFANNGWLQETPDFITKLTWDNAAVMSPSTAKALGVKTNDMVKVSVGDASVDMAVYVQPGQPAGTVAVAVGYGRTMAGIVGGYYEEGFEQVGFDVSPLRRHDALYSVTGAKVAPIGGTYRLATTQTHHMIDTTGQKAIQKRAPQLIRMGSIGKYQEDPRFAKKMDHHPALKSLWDERDWDGGHQWGMSVDLSSCIGCNACVVACTSENNVPIVGKHEVLKGREMHWMRIDRYFKGEAEDPEAALQPLMCQHCQNAPCEQVCPVAATVHSSEGTNDMAYNRCIGTRYCANNCPYKVRRFNFLNYHEDLKEPRNKPKTMIFNPDVTVRSRGVMEKCSYCIQRIHYAKRAAKVEGRPLRDGDVVSACQSACPTDAIVFGDINNRDSRVHKLQSLPRNYSILQELNTKPRTQYLAQIKNPNPALAEA